MSAHIWSGNYKERILPLLEPMGFITQPDWTSCGACSFGHASLLLGETMSHDQAQKRCRTVSIPAAFRRKFAVNHLRNPRQLYQRIADAAGTDPGWIVWAIKNMNWNPIECNTFVETEALGFVDHHLDNGHPVIISVDDATHWAVLAGKISKDYVLIDSGIGQQVFSTYTRNSLLERRWYALCDNCEGTGFREGTICDACLGSCYERYGIVIDPGNHLSRHLQSNARTIIEALMGNHLLQEYWGYYLDDLTDVFDAHHGAGSAPASDFFENHEEDILEAVSYWLIGVTKPEVRRELKHYRAVAESYPLYYRSAETARVLAHFQAAFMGMLIEDYL